MEKKRRLRARARARVCVCVIECVYVCYMVHIVELVCIDFFVLLTEDYSRNNAEEIGWPGAQLAF